MTSIAHLYRIENLKTGEYYIGKHNGITQKDFRGNDYWGSGDRIKRQIRKYGVENFKYEILVISESDYIFDLEKKMVTKELLESDEKCLNLCAGGRGANIHTKETRKLLSENIKKTYENPKVREKNRIATLRDREKYPEKWKEAAKKAGLNKRGIIFSEEHRKKLSDAGKGKEPWNKGKKNTISEEGLKVLKEKCKKLTSNMIWVNNGIQNKRPQKENVQKYINDGWVKGRLRGYIDDKYREQRKLSAIKQWQKIKNSGE